jgi:hypothetical protein
MCLFPDVLSRMNQNLDWTQDLGDAFLAQQQEVMNAVQRMRKQARNAGNLKSTSQEKVVVEQQVVRIEPASPDIIYVPDYNPTVVYGPSWYAPSWYYPAMMVPPPGYVAAASAFSFAAGVAVGGAMFGGCNWGGGNVYVNNNYYNNRLYRNQTNTNQNANVNKNTTNNWQHDPAHRGSVPYRDQATANRYGQMGGRGKEDNDRASRGFGPGGMDRGTMGAEGAARRMSDGGTGMDRPERGGDWSKAGGGNAGRDWGRDAGGADRGDRSDFGGRGAGNMDWGRSGAEDHPGMFHGMGNGGFEHGFSDRGGMSRGGGFGGGGHRR